MRLLRDDHDKKRMQLQGHHHTTRLEQNAAPVVSSFLNASSDLVLHASLRSFQNVMQ